MSLSIYEASVPVFRAAGRWSPVAQQYLLRCAAIPFGALGVLLAFQLTRTLFPRDVFLAVTVPTLVGWGSCSIRPTPFLKPGNGAGSE